VTGLALYADVFRNHLKYHIFRLPCAKPFVVCAKQEPSMTQIQDHPHRYALANELHARPFPALKVPCRAAYLAVKSPGDSAARDKSADRAHLLALLDRYGAPHPQPEATHYFGQIGKYQLKWESHTEFVTYTIFSDGVADRPFDGASFDVFSKDWLAQMPGVRITSALIRVEETTDDDMIRKCVDEWFVAESLAVARVVDDNAVVAGDFRIDEAGHLRFAVFARPGTGERRVGRIVQRLCEIETYKTMAMLGLTEARGLNDEISGIEDSLSSLTGDMSAGSTAAADTLSDLLNASARLENLITKSSFRFGATGAYEAIVNQRVKVLREERFNGRQTFAEFMMRRFDPAMRTVKASEKRLNSMAGRAQRAGNLLRTRVDVERSAENKALLQSMDRRADLQLRLQATVEGLSVVAISYYAVNLAAYLSYPVTQALGLSKGITLAGLTPFVVLGVYLGVRQIRKSMGH
jgi:uncharacterized membrane-anchored protein